MKFQNQLIKYRIMHLYQYYLFRIYEAVVIQSLVKLSRNNIFKIEARQ